MLEQRAYGIFVKSPKPYEEARSDARAALMKEGFGVLTEIDVQSTLKQKLGVDFRRYEIIGACNPTLAHGALTAEQDIGLLLPCNVVVYENEDGTSTVGAFDPLLMAKLTANDTLTQAASEARQRLERALIAVEAGAGA